jgi:signal transduction histidine kinase
MTGLSDSSADGAILASCDRLLDLALLATGLQSATLVVELGDRSWSRTRPDPIPVGSAIRSDGAVSMTEALSSPIGHCGHVTLVGDEMGSPHNSLAATISLVARQIEAIFESHERAGALNSALSRYRTIFDQSRIGFFEQDLSALRRRLAALRAQGVTDIRAHAALHPDFVENCLDLIRTVDVNDACVALMGAKDRSDLLGPTKFRPPVTYRIGALEALFEGRQRIDGKTILQTVDGRFLTVLFHAIVETEGMLPNHVIFSVLDVTDQEETHERLLAAQEVLAQATRVSALGAISGSLAHELNQPLAAISNDAQSARRWLSRNPPVLDEALPAITRVVAGAERASEIVKVIRSRFAEGRSEPELINLGTVARESCALLQREWRRHEATVQIHIADNLPTVSANAVDISQVFVNIITNALQSMSAAESSTRQVEIAITATSFGVDVEVRDHGPGFTHESIHKALNAFYTSKADGMGIGLAICQTSVESFGGTLRLDNHPEGGAIVGFTLPAA